MASIFSAEELQEFAKEEVQVLHSYFFIFVVVFFS